jgi:hypothetical protein
VPTPDSAGGKCAERRDIAGAGWAIAELTEQQDLPMLRVGRTASAQKAVEPPGDEACAPDVAHTRRDSKEYADRLSGERRLATGAGSPRGGRIRFSHTPGVSTRATDPAPPPPALEQEPGVPCCRAVARDPTLEPAQKRHCCVPPLSTRDVAHAAHRAAVTGRRRAREHAVPGRRAVPWAGRQIVPWTPHSCRGRGAAGASPMVRRAGKAARPGPRGGPRSRRIEYHESVRS